MSDRPAGPARTKSGESPEIDRDDPVADEAGDETTAPESDDSTGGREPGGVAVLVLMVLGVVLLAMMLRGEHGMVTAAHGIPQVVAIQIGLFLSSVLLAGMVFGGAVGLAAARAGRPGPRVVRALAGGLAAGVLGGGAAVLLERQVAGVATAVAVALLVAGVLGGALAALRPGAMVAAGLSGCVAAVLLLTLRGLFIGQLTRLFGGTGTIAHYATAQSNIALVSSIVAGLAAGITAHVYLRRTGHRLGLPGNLTAGATAGLLSLAAQVVTLVAGARLVIVGGGLDLGDQLAFRLSNWYQINGGLALLFAGAFTAVVLYGRTKGPRRRRTVDDGEDGTPDWVRREEEHAAERERQAEEAP